MPRLDYFLRRSLFLSIALVMTTTIFSLSSFAADAPIVVAQVVAQGSKSSGNEVVKSIEAGKDYKGMTKREVVDAIGEPWQKDTTPEKARYDEKWIYSCQAKDGLTYDCAYLYFMGDRVVNVEVL